MRPNLVLVVVDDWALSDLEAARADGDPWNDLVAVEALAGMGQSWNHFYAQPVCNPTRMTLMFGRYRGDRSGEICAPADADTPAADFTLARLLQSNGYATAAFGKWHIGTNPVPAGDWVFAPEAYGFDAWRAWNASNLGGHCGSSGYDDWHRVDDGVERMSAEYHTEAVALAFLDWWQATAGPRFAYVCFQAPHQPLHAPPAHLLPPGYPAPSSRRDRYEAMLVAFDTMLVSILQVVDLDDTVLLVVGDNGTPPAAARADQNPTRVKTTTFEDGVNVPFLVAGPGVVVGETDALGHVVDLPATLLELAGAALAPGEAPDSVSFVPVLADGAARVRDHVICDNVILDTEVEHRRDTCVVLDSPHGLVKGRFFEDDLLGIATACLYDLDADPEEANPLAANDPLFGGEIARIRELWAAYLAR